MVSVANRFKIVKGIIPVLFSAPHAYLHERPALDSLVKGEEEKTDQIVQWVCEDTGSYGIFTTGRQQVDPNYYPERENEYKQKLREIAHKNDIRYLFDIHGFDDMRNCDITLLYRWRYYKSGKMAYDIAEALGGRKSDSKLIVQVKNLPDDGYETIAAFATKELSLGAVQMEISRDIRSDEQLLKNVLDLLEQYVVEM